MASCYIQPKNHRNQKRGNGWFSDAFSFIPGAKQALDGVWNAIPATHTEAVQNAVGDNSLVGKVGNMALKAANPASLLGGKGSKQTMKQQGDGWSYPLQSAPQQGSGWFSDAFSFIPGAKQALDGVWNAIPATHTEAVQNAVGDNSLVGKVGNMALKAANPAALLGGKGKSKGKGSPPLLLQKDLSKPKKQNAWITYVKNFHSSRPHLTFKQALQQAKIERDKK